ncbi:hypothetical protein SAMN05421812_13631 [Asanoa hainanensis]|uniref:Uncharacterized protein n=1 Tax=Asanoa hainanensis TaxID=560556 RepID=A0A239PI49_9ACTN|nr:hypothetical protein [Asanoa hainanensis]SNT66284.1 hypothetical protein SAMN05421812_13631 [Asanoa hainanensis]
MTGTAYIKAYRASARQLAAIGTGAEWWRIGTPLANAIAWADLGYLPDGAAPLIAAGIAPDLAREMDALANQLAGGSTGHAAHVIDRLVTDGVLVDPRLVRQHVDPRDPTHALNGPA